MIAVRGKENGGGFLILGKKTALPVFSGTSSKLVGAGCGELRLNKGDNAKWSSWVLILAPSVGGDKPPKNRS